MNNEELKKYIPLLILIIIVISVGSFYILNKLTYKAPKTSHRSDLNKEIEYSARDFLNKKYTRLTDNDLEQVKDIYIYKEINDFEGINKLKNLSTLYLEYLSQQNSLNNFKDRNIKYLTINGGYLNQDDLVFFENKRFFELEINNVTFEEDFKFPNSLEVLNLTVNNSTIKSKDAFQSISKITELTVKNTNITKMGFDFNKHKNLRTLNIKEYTYLDNSKFLNNLTNLKEVFLDITYLDGDELLNNFKKNNVEKIKFTVDDDNYNLGELQRVGSTLSDLINVEGKIDMTITCYNR